MPFRNYGRKSAQMDMLQMPKRQRLFPMIGGQTGTVFVLDGAISTYGKEIGTYLTTSSSFCIAQLDVRLTIRDWNLGFIRLFTPRQSPEGTPLSDFLVLGDGELLCNVELKLLCNRKSGMTGVICCTFIQMENGYLLLCERLLLTESHVLEEMGGINNELINLQRDLEKKNRQLNKQTSELQAVIAELHESLTRVKMLEGIIPICMYCKKIRDDHNSWSQLEQYISKHSKAKFSHGICPNCVKEKLSAILPQKTTD
jgi:hypothetical protein